MLLASFPTLETFLDMINLMYFYTFQGHLERAMHVKKNHLYNIFRHRSLYNF